MTSSGIEQKAASAFSVRGCGCAWLYTWSVCIYTRTDIGAHMCVYIYMSMYIYTYTEEEQDKERGRDRDRDRETERKAGRQGG